jgi:hypothetical protein
MDMQPVRYLLVHGSIVILFGLLSGIPFWVAVIRGQDEGAIRAWRVAHTTLNACGLLMLVVNLISPLLDLSRELRSLLAWALVASGYGFVFALVVGACTGYRALVPKPVGFNTLLFMGHLIGAVGAVLAMFIVLYGLLQE